MGLQPSSVRLRAHGKFAVSLAPGAIVFTRSSLLAWQSLDEKILSAPLVTRNSIWDVPIFTSHGMVPPLVTFRLSSGFSSRPYAGLSVDAETVTRFWWQAGVGVGVGVGVGAALGAADGESLGAGACPAASAVAPAV